MEYIRKHIRLLSSITIGLIISFCIIFALSIRTDKYNNIIDGYFRNNHKMEIIFGESSNLIFRPLPNLAINNVYLKKDEQSVLYADSLKIKIPIKNALGLSNKLEQISLSGKNVRLEGLYSDLIISDFIKKSDSNTAVEGRKSQITCQALNLSLLEQGSTVNLYGKNCTKDSYDGIKIHEAFSTGILDKSSNQEKERRNSLFIKKNDKSLLFQYKDENDDIKVSFEKNQDNNKLVGSVKAYLLKGDKNKSTTIEAKFIFDTQTGTLQITDFKLQGGQNDINLGLDAIKQQDGVMEVNSKASINEVDVGILYHLISHLDISIYDLFDLLYKIKPSLQYDFTKVRVFPNMEYKGKVDVKDTDNVTTLDAVLENTTQDATQDNSIVISLKNDKNNKIRELYGVISLNGIEISSLNEIKTKDNNAFNKTIDIISQKYDLKQKVNITCDISISEGQVDFKNIKISQNKILQGGQNDISLVSNSNVANITNDQKLTNDQKPNSQKNPNSQNIAKNETIISSNNDASNANNPRLQIDYSIADYGYNETRYSIKVNTDYLDLDKLGYTDDIDHYITKLYAADLGRSSDHHNHIFENKRRGERNESLYYDISADKVVYRGKEISNFRINVAIKNDAIIIKNINLETDYLGMNGQIKMLYERNKNGLVDIDLFFSKLNLQQTLGELIPNMEIIEQNAVKILDANKLTKINKSNSWNFFNFGKHFGQIKLRGNRITLSKDNVILYLDSAIKIDNGIATIESLSAKYQDKGEININGSITLDTVIPSMQFGIIGKNISTNKMSKDFKENSSTENVLNFNGKINCMCADNDSFISKSIGNFTFAGRNWRMLGINFKKIIEDIDSKNLEQYKDKDINAAITEIITTGDTLFDKASGSANIQNGITKVKIEQLSNNRVNGAVSLNYDIRQQYAKGTGSFAFGSIYNKNPIYVSLAFMRNNIGETSYKVNIDSILKLLQQT